MNQIKKWYTYQKERFPVLVYGLYVFCIVFATFCYSYYYYNAVILTSPIPTTMYLESTGIQYIKLIPMFLVAFLQFLMVRILDEFKDYEEDCKYRPYRPVPRGLVKLSELKVLLIICAVLQVIITIFFSNSIYNILSFICLMVVWAYILLMNKDFFMKKFLDKHLLINVALDEMVLPLLIIYLSTFICPTGSWLAVMAYIISWIVEVARKIRCKEDEEEGVKTYTAVLGIGKAMILIFVLETLLMVVQGIILGQKNYIWIVALYILANIPNILFAKKKTKKMAKLAGLSANIYIAIVYCSLVILIL